jgi:hypothetical protein
MKKMILAALVAVASLSANAQVWVGGEVGFSAGKTTIDGDKQGSGANFSFLPEIGYTLNDKFDIAVGIGFTHANGNGDAYLSFNEKDDYSIGALADANRNTFILNPYVRYKFVKSGDFTFFVDGGFAYKYIHYSGIEDNGNAWELGFKPGIAYGLSDKVSLVAHVGKLGYDFGKVGDTKTNEFSIGLANNISFGAYVSF